jgi:prepilin-type N-terminal cleavage/methylation domain-containing protein
MDHPRTAQGFSLVEIMVAVAVVGVVAVVALPVTGRTLGGLRLKGDAQAITNSVALTKMRAASSFSRARLFVDLDANRYFVQVWDRTANTWVTEGGDVRLSGGVAFGLGGISVPPPNTQVAIGQSDVCQDDDGNDIGNTACIVFNSRGIPVDAVGSPTGRNALYVTDGTGVYGTTLTATPLVRLWWSPAGRDAWVEQ